MKKNKIDGLDERCHDCGQALPKSPSYPPFSKGEAGGLELPWCYRFIGLCRYCYRHKFPARGRPSWPAISQSNQRFLSWTERREMERDAFDTTQWSPEFYAEWIAYWIAQGIRMK